VRLIETLGSLAGSWHDALMTTIKASENVSATSTPSTTTTGEPITGLNALRPRLLHVSYHVADIDRALAFYVGVLGMKEQLRLDLGGGVQEVVLGFPQSKGGGVILMWHIERTKPRELGDGYSRFVLSVSDIEAAMQHLASAHTPVVTPITDAGALKYAMVKDPDGYVIELLEMKRA
jgi:lactoylglutathione lyase